MMKLPVNYNELTFIERKRIREEYINIQKGKCKYCGEYLHNDPSEEVKNKWINLKLFPPNFLKYPLHLHHDHITGLTIGTVHARCNAVLWQYHGE